MRIYVEEEYGYRQWEWLYPGTPDELIADWKAGVAPLNFFDPSRKDPAKPFKGELVEIEAAIIYGDDKKPVGFDAHAHVHEPDDSFLAVNDIVLEHPDKIK
jgi:hypothetical protein